MSFMIYNTTSFPVLKIFEDNVSSIREELVAVMNKPMIAPHQSTWMQERPDLVKTVQKGWKSYTFRFFGINHLPNMDSCPITANLIKSIPSIVTAEFSLLSANTHILPHTGFTNEVLRAHLGLIIPNGDVQLRVEDKIVNWEEGKVLFFDDSKEHETWNNTNEDRVVLMFDIVPNFDADVAKQVSKGVLEQTNDAFIHSLAPREKWLEWLDKGEFPLDI